MSASSVATIWCDEPDCPTSFTTGQPGTIDTRNAARGHGWRQVGGRDLCPTCMTAAFGAGVTHA